MKPEGIVGVNAKSILNLDRLVPFTGVHRNAPADEFVIYGEEIIANQLDA